MKELKSYIFESSNSDSKIVFKKSVFNNFFKNKQCEITVNGEKINIINITFDRKTERGNELFRFNYDIESQIQIENANDDFYYQITCEIIKYIFDTIFGENNWNDFFKLGSIDTYKVNGRLEGTSGLYKTLPIKNNDATQDSVCLYYENNEFKTESKSKKGKSLYIPLNQFNNLYIANQHDAYYGKITIGRKTVTPNKILKSNPIKLDNLNNDNLNIDNIFNSQTDKHVRFCKNYLTNFINKLKLLNFNEIIKTDNTIDKDKLAKIEITVEKEHFIFNDESNNFILSDKDLDNFFNDFGEVLSGVFMLFCFEKDNASLEFPKDGNNPFADFYIEISKNNKYYFSAKHDDGAACSIKNFTQKSSEDTQDIFDIFNDEKNSVIDTIIQLANFYKDKKDINNSKNTLNELSNYMHSVVPNKETTDNIEFTKSLFTDFRDKINDDILDKYFRILNYKSKQDKNKINYTKTDFLLYPLKSFLCKSLNMDESFINTIHRNCHELNSNTQDEKNRHYQIYIKHKNNSYNTLKFEIIDLETDIYNISIVNGGDINNVNNQSFRLKFKPN